jgi:filamentous hemagglutinin
MRKGISENQNLNVHYAKQNRHIVDSGNYMEGRSILTADPEMLIEMYAGKAAPIIIDGEWNNRERFEHTEFIGIWKSSDGVKSLPTSRGVIHYSKHGVHIVPARPADYK